MTDTTPITTPSAPPAGPYTPGLVSRRLGFPGRPDRRGRHRRGAGQATLGKIDALLAVAGCAPADVVSCLVHLADLSDFQRFNAIYEPHFPEPRPVRTTVGASLLGGALVEITAIARRPSR